VKKLFTAIAILGFCASALAADPAAGNAANSSSPNEGQAYSWAKFHWIYGRLGLTEEQLQKIDAIYLEYQEKIKTLHKELHAKKLSGKERKEAYKELRTKIAELEAERDEKILEVLTEGQKKKILIARKVKADFDAKMTELRKGYVKARSTKDRSERKKIYKELSEKRTELYKEKDKQLDAKVGKLPERPKEGGGQNPGQQGPAGVVGGA
jgi:Spy/CpxP family protein refolding chaperone